MSKKKFEAPKLTTDELSAELVLANLKLAKAHKRLLEEEQARNEMFSSISHDLRSPITAVKNAVELLSNMEEYSPEAVTPLLQLMQGRIDTLEQLINDIFLLVSLDNHCEPMKLELVPLLYFLEDFFFSREADQCYRERKLLLDVPEDLDVSVQIEPHSFIRVLDNLFTNALKYSNTGDSICLRAACKEDEVLISVCDTGIGIPPEDTEKVFERCYRVEKARTPGVSSTGLGLAITRSIVKQFSGKIWCESTLGEGSTFTISLPILKESKEEPFC